ncbi:TRAP transporter large permease [Sphaerochaeta sp. PS]|uniref:TRAP transporter large permease n=1 Tax=Sphaerochaeta sp. PS TaxID=3076336 RepID=UPI0028A54D03|nr:TRAP transporter large permease [Sphaerochaeta sp. PS]MDT4763350.1 TRAP transporter large permease [Sphaerochaeta sp. PS]
MIVILFVIMFVFIGLGASIWVSMGFSGVLYILLRGDVSLRLVASQMVGGVSADTLLAIPFFILAGNLMGSSGITNKLLQFSNFFVGKYRAGLAYVSIMTSIFLAGVSGSAVSDASSTSAVLHPIMRKRGYDDAFSASINASSAIIGPIIPPSIPMVNIGVISGISIGKLFLGGYFPGLLMAIGLWILVTLVAKKRNYPIAKVERSWKIFFSLLKETSLALLAPVIIIVGVISGVVTITEVAVLANFYILLISVFVYRSINFKNFFETVRATAVFCCSIMIIFAAVGVFQYIVSSEQLGKQLMTLIVSLNMTKTTFLLFCTVFFLFMGCILDAVPVILIFFPVLLPIAIQLGVDPVHFGVITVLNLMIGLITPPVGALLFIETKIANIDINVLLKEIWPHIAVLLGTLLLITFVPVFVTFLPNLFFK